MGWKRSGWPPMMASAIGSPSTPVRTTDCGEPPTATQMGSGSWSGRGYTPRLSIRRVCSLPGQSITSPWRRAISSCSFSENSSS